MSDQKPHIAFRILKFFGWLLLALVVLVVALRLSLKTNWVNDFAKEQALSIVNENLMGTLNIDKLRGDLWKEFTATGINLQQEDTLLTADTLHINYDILTLLSDKFQVNELLLSGLSANVEEQENQEFNVQNIIPEDTTATTSEEGGGFNFEINDFKLRNSSAQIYAPSYLPDSSLNVKNIHADASFSGMEDISASLSSLAFNVREGRLPQAISVQTAATYEDDEITLQELLVETGRSVLSAYAEANLQDSTLSAEAKTRPFSLADIQPYLENDLPDEAFDITMEISGSMAALNVTLNMDGEGFNDLLITSELSLQEEPTLKSMELSVQNINIAYLTNDSLDAEIGEFHASLDGSISAEVEQTNLSWSFRTENIRYEDYSFEEFFGDGILNAGNILANIHLNDGQEKVVLLPKVQRVFSEHPDWQLAMALSEINPGKWAQNPEMQGSVSLNGFFEGSGFQLSDAPWKFIANQQPLASKTPQNFDLNYFKQLGSGSSPDLFATDVQVAGYDFSRLQLSGVATEREVSLTGFIQQIENRLNFIAAVTDFSSDEPTFNYQINSNNFDIAELTDTTNISTVINFSAEGTGRYFDVEKMEMTSSVKIDSTSINGALIDSLTFNVNLDNGILNIPDGTLVSQMVSGSFSARKRMMSEIDPEDELNIDLQIQNLQPLAPVFGADILSAEGPVRGRIAQNDSIPEFDGTVELSQIRYDSLFFADEISGEVVIGLNDHYEYELDLFIAAPTASGVTLQDLAFSTAGTATTEDVAGNFRLQLQSVDAGEITQAGNYNLNLNSLETSLSWNVLNFQTPARLLSLESPFNLNYSNGTVITDTLSLASESSAYLKLAAPRVDSLHQQIWIEGEDFDFGVIQEMMFRERFVDGILQGAIAINRNPDSLAADGEIQISQLEYLDTQIDLLDLTFAVEDERLTAGGFIRMDGEEKIIGSLDVPFVLEDPTTLEDSFFEESVEGHLTIKPLRLSNFDDILQEFDITGTEGIISFEGSLSGTAGVPSFDGKLNLEDPTLSGIKVDSAFAEFNYNHLEENIFALVEIQAQGQQAASIYSNLPISMDFRTFELNTPSDTDTVTVNLETRDFNISVFNDFLDRQYLRNLEGVLNADISAEGIMSNLEPKGYLRLTDAKVNVPIAGIELNRIHSEINFTKNGLEIKNISMRSGGNFNANGTITLDGTTPTDINLNAQAEQFKLANTNDYNLTIDLNSQLTGSPMRPVASGELTVRNGFIFLQDFGERSVEAVELEGEEEPSFSPYDSLAIQMQFNIDRNFYVRNSRYLDLEVELTGELDAQKETDGELQLFGTLTGERGYALPLGKRFELEEADFTFSGPLEDPALSIRTSYVPQTPQKEGSPIVLFYIIEGTAQEPEFRFESDPQMEQQDIIAYTLFGRPFYALDSWQQVVSGGNGGSSPTDMLVDVLLDEVEALATRELGIDVVQIDNTRSGSDAVTSIKTGWYLNRRTFFSVVNEISSDPKTLFILEYMLRDNLDLILTQGDDNRQGIDIRWQYEY